MANELVKKQIMEKYGIDYPTDDDLAQAQQSEREANLYAGLGGAGATIAEGIGRTQISRAPYEQFAKPFADRTNKIETQRLAAGEVVRQRLIGDEKFGQDKELIGMKKDIDAEQETGRQKFEMKKLGAQQYAENQRYADKARIDAEVAAKQSGEKARAGLLTGTNDLRKEYLSNPNTKLMPEIINSYQKLEAAANEESAIGDMSVVFNYMKLLDPGSSVREGEFALAENARGVPESILNAYNKIISGERLSQAQRDEFIRGARNAYASHARTQKGVDDYYSGLSNDMGLNPKHVIVPYHIGEPVDEVANGENTYRPAGAGASIQSESVNRLNSKEAAMLQQYNMSYDQAIAKLMAEKGIDAEHADRVFRFRANK